MSPRPRRVGLATAAILVPTALVLGWFVTSSTASPLLVVRGSRLTHPLQLARCSRSEVGTCRQRQCAADAFVAVWVDVDADGRWDLRGENYAVEAMGWSCERHTEAGWTSTPSSDCDLALLRCMLGPPP